MSTQDEALTISNPRLLSAVYFSLLSIIVTIGLDTLLYALGVKQFMPISKAIFLSVVVAAIFGALFGKRIIHSEKPYRGHVFLWAFLMVILSLPVYNVGFLYLIREHHTELFSTASIGHLLYLYLFVLGYSFILAGVWVAIAAGLAAIYLRSHVVYYILQSQYKRRRNSDTSTKGSQNK